MIFDTDEEKFHTHTNIRRRRVFEANSFLSCIPTLHSHQWNMYNRLVSGGKWIVLSINVARLYTYFFRFGFDSLSSISQDQIKFHARSFVLCQDFWRLHMYLYWITSFHFSRNRNQKNRVDFIVFIHLIYAYNIVFVSIFGRDELLSFTAINQHTHNTLFIDIAVASYTPQPQSLPPRIHSISQFIPANLFDLVLTAWVYKRHSPQK